MDKDTVAYPANPPALLAVTADSMQPTSFVPVARVGRVAFSLLVLVALGDWLLWEQAVGLSSGLYALLLAAGILLNRSGMTWHWRHGLQVGLLALAAIQTALRPSLSNALVSWTLLLVIAGDTALPALRPVWLRWGRAAFSALGFFVSWAVFVRSLAWWTKQQPGGAGRRLARLWSVIWLAVLMMLGFGTLLISGNVILHGVFKRLYKNYIHVLWDISLPHPAHIVFWGILATVALVLLMPRVGRWSGERCRREVPTFAVTDPTLARWRSLLALGAVNVLFFFANSLDVLYLWAERELPEGVGYAGYVHRGVWSLILVVLLSALVLTLIFQQDASVSGSRWLKGLALLWIGQNLFLELGVVMRLTLYINAHAYLTPKRVYVMVFLSLVAVGYGLLVRHILWRRSFKQLLLGNALAVFGLFYLLQFINVPRLVADYDYQMWLKNPRYNIMQKDLYAVLGSEMAPLAVRVAESGLDVPAVLDAREQLRFGEWRGIYGKRWSPWGPWQSWTLRRAQLYQLLKVYAAENLD